MELLLDKYIVVHVEIDVVPLIDVVPVVVVDHHHYHMHLIIIFVFRLVRHSIDRN